MRLALASRPPRLPRLAAPGTAVIEAHGATFSYQGLPAMSRVDLVVRAGEVHCIVGPNGAGKSTLLAALAGDLALDSGRVIIDGAAASDWSPDELAIRRGVLLQQTSVSFPFTVAEVVRMGRAPWAGTPAEEWDDDIVADVVVEADVADLVDRVFTSLSGGERARVALARVLAQESSALLLDEPTAALDIRHQEQVFQIVRRRAERGDAALVVVHDLGLAAAHADVITVMSDGAVVASGTPSEVLGSDLLTMIYQYPIETFPHPNTGSILVTPTREVPL